MGSVRAPVGVKLSAFNWRMWNARKDAGYTQQDLALLTGISLQRLGTIETLRTRPRLEEQQEIADALDLGTDDLFPPEVLALYGNISATLRVAVPAERMAQLAGGPADALCLPDAMCQPGMREAIDGVVSSLDAREQTVLAKRYGLDGDGVCTLADVGQTLGVTGMRIRQIEAKALRKLRHPSRAKMVLAYAQSDDTRVAQGVAPKIRREPTPEPKPVPVPDLGPDDAETSELLRYWEGLPAHQRWLYLVRFGLVDAGKDEAG